jgi:ketosteroid isomerase-like protein
LRRRYRSREIRQRQFNPVSGKREILRVVSKENVEVVRQPVATRTTSRRSWDERVAFRFPRALALVARVVLRLPPHSRLRQVLIRRSVRLTFEATWRGDYESMVQLYHPDGELIVPRELVALGFEPVVRGREERARFQRRWDAEWGKMQIRPEEIIYLGNERLLLVGRITGTGLTSGVPVNDEWAEMLTLSAGRAIREQVFFDHLEALEAAGLLK